MWQSTGDIMVDSIKPTYRVLPNQSATKRNETPSGVESHSDDKYSIPASWSGEERRRQGDRRREEEERKKKFDMRASVRGRRDSDRPYPRIEIKV